MHPNSALMFRAYGRPYIQGRVLEIGARPIPSTLQKFSRNVESWETLNIEPVDGLTHLVPYPYDYPFPSDTYDTVVSANVLEHVEYPWRWFPEQARVLKPGGHLVCICPLNWPLHQDPVDCWRVLPDGMKALLKWANLEEILVLPGMLAGDEVSDLIGVGRKV